MKIKGKKVFLNKTRKKWRKIWCRCSRFGVTERSLALRLAHDKDNAQTVGTSSVAF